MKPVDDRVPTGGTTDPGILIEIELMTTIPAKATAPIELDSVATVVSAPGVVVVYSATDPGDVVTGPSIVPAVADVDTGIKLPFVHAQNSALAGMKLTDCFKINPVAPSATGTSDALVFNAPEFAVVIELARYELTVFPAVITTKSVRLIDVEA